MVRVLISTGEVSGDLQGSLLVRALHRQARHRGLDLEVLALGGPRMRAAGAELLADTAALGSIGLLFSNKPSISATLRPASETAPRQASTACARAVLSDFRENVLSPSPITAAVAERFLATFMPNH